MLLSPTESVQVHDTVVRPIPWKKDPDCLSQTAGILPGTSSVSVQTTSGQGTKFPALLAKETTETSLGHVATGGVFVAVKTYRQKKGKCSHT